MKYTLVISSNPRQRGNTLALDFANALLDKKHTLCCVFFMDEGVSTALSSCLCAQDERNIREDWAQLADHCELTVCSASAAKYGVLGGTEAKRGTLHPAFTLDGLGVLVAATANSDRVVNF